MITNKLLKDLRECSGMGFEACKEAINYCKKHKDCSPFGYLTVMYSGVKYSDIDKAIREQSIRLAKNPLHYTKGTDVCKLWKDLNT